MGRLGIGSTIGMGLAGIWSQRVILGPILLGWLIAEAVFLGGYRYFGLHLRSDFIDQLAPVLPWVSPRDWPYLIHTVVMIPHNLYGSVFVVLAMRIFLFATPLGPHEYRATLARSVLAVFLFKYAIATYHLAWQWITFGFAGMIPYPIAWTIFWSIGVAIAARFCFLYATASMGRGWQLRRCWQDAAGNGVRLFLMFVAIDIPVLALGKVLETVVLVSTSDAGSGLEMAMLALLGAAKRVVASTVLLALIAAAFARLTDFPAAGVPGAGRVREKLVEAFE